MSSNIRVVAVVICVLAWALAGAPAFAQSPPRAAGHSSGQAAGQVADPQQHDHAQMEAGSTGWHLMQDGVIYGLFNHQGGPRGGDEFVVPNWWMGMATRQVGRHQFGLNGMFSLDPATLGKDGYGELFQVGETLDGEPLIDRQHPHDLFMQVAASWKVTLGDETSFALAGGPAGEPTLGPVAFMHRASAAGLPFAPLGHHTFDSTHISFGVVSASLTHRRWTVEGSVFNGREPDEERWDFDFGPLDSVAGRVWFRPSDNWELQASTGRLREPEILEPGDAHRTTTSVSWFQPRGTGFSALTAGYGVNSAHDDRRHGVFGEFTMEREAGSLFGRLEVQQVETGPLLGQHDEGGGGHGHEPEPPRAVVALTVGAAKPLVTWRGFEGALAAQATFHGVPDVLTPTHGNRPVSFQVFFRLRLPTGEMGRIWNMRMSRPH
jgi:hypothetical protein